MRSILLLSILLFGACSSAKHDVRATDSDAAAKRLVSYARSLVGIHYKYGGNSPKAGFDCSGFVDHVFRHTQSIDLPRSSEEISHAGQAVSADNLGIGDLVFFNTLHHRFSHVGIYVGGDRFIHAPSSSTGSVRTDNMREDYWKKHYDGARRITLHG
jgi:cell wall-associated NlpC family hydrolase